MTDRLWRLLTSWQAPAILSVLLLGLFIWWVVPRPVPRVQSLDSAQEWDAGRAPAQRQVLWEPPQSVAGLLPDPASKGSLITPRLADNGATLYFTYRPAKGHAEIYRSRYFDGRWQPAEPVAELNTPADDIGPALSKDGRHLYFYSNRPGGHGGFDLYVSERTASGWGAPRNLGPRVNSPAHEYDPAPSPDGTALYFASNRTAGMANRAATPEDEKGDWAATIRAHPGLTQFDLYVCRRSAADTQWSAPEALAELNTPANEGAPFVSPSGSFLYFASDRPARPGEAPNLDLYRARRSGERFVGIENLGRGINTAAHETEPALSPEGFTLVFSSDRDGSHLLYRSTAQEVVARTDWDTRAWQVVARVWWMVLLMALSTLALFLVLWYTHGWLVKKATAARFFLASLLLHCLLLLLMGYVGLGMAIVGGIAEVSAQATSAQLSGDSQQPFEKVADLRAVEAAQLSPLVRQITTPAHVPERTEAPVPTLPVPQPRVLPPSRIQYQLPPEQTPVQPLDEPPRRTRTDRMQLAEISPVQPAVPPAVAAPAEKPIEERTVSPIRASVPMPPVPSVAAPRPAESPQAVRLSAIPVQPAEQREPRPPIQPPAVVMEKRPTRTIELATSAEKVQLPAPAASAGTKASDTPGAAVTVARAAPAETVPAGIPAVSVTPAQPTVKLPELPPRRIEDNPQLKAIEGAPVKATRSKLDLADDLPRPPAETVTGKGTEPPAEKPLPAAPLAVPRPAVTLPGVPLRTPTEPGGPTAPEQPRIAIGSPSKQPVDVPPTLSPLAESLPRRSPRADMVARLTEAMSAEAMFKLRDAETRKEAVKRFGGTPESEAAVDRGLEWLAGHQGKSGSWSLSSFHANCKNHAQCSGAAVTESGAGATALALLPFLGRGHTHKSDSKYQQVVARGIKWLIEEQRKDGLLDTSDYRSMYGHALAAIVLCEAYAMTRDPDLRAPAQRSLDFIIKAQHPGTGGWRYQPGQTGDTSVFGWQVMALKSGEAGGLEVPAKAWEGSRRWLTSVEGNQPVGGLFGYQNPNPTPAMTAQGLLSLQLMGTRRDDRRMQAGADYLLKQMPRRSEETSYYWYHATQVMYHMGGKYWTTWNENLRDLLVATQHTKGGLAGTWDPLDPREKSGGRIYSTSLRLLMLEVYYRHLPLYQQLEK